MPYRVREKYKANPQAIFDPSIQAHVVPDPRLQFDDDHPLVVMRPDYFIKEGEEEEEPPTSIRIADIEQATRAPNEKRRGPGRPRKPTA